MFNDAPCVGKPPSMFVFSNPDRARLKIAKAKAVCADCPAATKEACLQLGLVEIMTPTVGRGHSVEQQDDNAVSWGVGGGLPDGIFGGFTQAERRAIVEGQ